MIKKHWSALLVFIVCLALPLTVWAAPLDVAKDIVKENYVGNISGDIDKATSIPALMSLLDPYSTYFTPEEFNQFLNSVDMTSVGIGVVIEKVDAGIKISDLIDGGSAKSAGLKTGDIITMIDDTATAALSINQASALITGEANTNVSLTLLREDGSILKKTLLRKAFSVPNVTSKLLYGQVGYISLNSFSNDTASLISKAVRELQGKGASTFILDLQNNGGGYVTAAEQLIGMFPNAKYAYILEEVMGTSSVPSSDKQTTMFPANTKVLVNALSASSSEMTAAALLDQKAATLYGQKTYGKGSMQAFYELEDGSYLKLTVGHFYGPSKTKINNVGIKPNVVTKGDAIYQAHFDSIAASLPTYKKLTSLKNVATDKTFTINFSKQLATSVDSKSVELVELGGNTIKVTATQTGEKLSVKPTKPLVAGKEYALIIHPSLNDASGKKLKKGSYLQISVAK